MPPDAGAPTPNGHGALGWPAAPLAAAYRGAVALRNWLFDTGLRRAHRVGIPVISVGNLTAGGTGKTPAVIWLVEHLQAAGRVPAVLLRGYGARVATGDGGPLVADEQLLLAERLPETRIVAGADRVAGGRQAVAGGADVCVCDDAFQHRRLARDLDIVCIDATNPFGGGHCLPWGLLREPAGGLRRADAVLLTRSDQIDAAALEALRQACRRLLRDGARPVLATTHAPTDVLDVTGPQPLGTLAGQAVYVVSGVGNPAAVQRTAAQAGADVRGATAFPDHHAWTDADLARCADAARAAGAEVLLTTEKDWVKIRALPAPALPVRALRIGLQFSDDPAPLTALISQALQRHATATS